MDSLTHFFATSPFGTAQVADSLWLIIALPLMGALVCGLFGKRLGRANVNLLACTTVAGSFLLSVAAFWTAVDSHTALSSPYLAHDLPYAVGKDYGIWFFAGTFRVDFGLMVDHLSGVMLLVVTGVGFLIHLYS